MIPRDLWLLLLAGLVWTLCAISGPSISPLVVLGGGMGGVPPMVALRWL